MSDSSTHTSTPGGRPAREDEVRPSDDMQSADRANGEPDATEATPGHGDRSDINNGSDTATLVTDDPVNPPGAPAETDGPPNDETGKATLVTDEPGE